MRGGGVSAAAWRALLRATGLRLDEPGPLFHVSSPSPRILAKSHRHAAADRNAAPTLPRAPAALRARWGGARGGIPLSPVEGFPLNARLYERVSALAIGESLVWPRRQTSRRWAPASSVVKPNRFHANNGSV